MLEPVRKRIEQTTGVRDLAAALAELRSDDLQTLLLEVQKLRVEKQQPAEVLRTYQSSRFVTPSAFDGNRYLAVQAKLSAQLQPDFRCVLLSPLAPLGSCCRLATVHPNKVVTTVRGQEVLADPTNSLALECALLRRRGEKPHLMAVSRVVRAQAVPGPGFYAHFGLLGMTSADQWSADFAESALHRHWSAVARILPGSTIRWTELAGGKLERIYAKVRSQLKDRLHFEPDPERQSGRGYYIGGCFKIYYQGLEVGDGGFTDWTQKLLGSRREALLISGLGLDRLMEFLIPLEREQELLD